jgi:hypothetical protein
MDENGKLIREDNVNYPGTGELYAQLNTAALPAGTYIVEIKAGSHAYLKQVIKQ